jgi:hypothetical protein
MAGELRQERMSFEKRLSIIQEVGDQDSKKQERARKSCVVKLGEDQQQNN